MPYAADHPAPPRQAPRVTTQVGRYEILDTLGRGAMAVVYLARHADLGKLVALKELVVLGDGDPRLAERFIGEARTTGALGHPNVVTAFDYFECGGLPYIAMEHVAGGSLRRLVGELTLAQVAGVLEGVLAGLAHAQRHGIVHRDLKPENLLVTEEGRIKVADFGIAKAIDRTAAGGPLTEQGMTAGTPRYMAPEQARAERLGPPADLYSLGVITFELLCHRPPFGGDDTPPAALMLQHIGDPVPDPLTLRPDLDPELSAWMLRLLAKEPAARPPDAVAAWDELEPIVLRLLGSRWRRQAPLPLAPPLAAEYATYDPGPPARPPGRTTEGDLPSPYRRRHRTPAQPAAVPPELAVTRTPAQPAAVPPELAVTRPPARFLREHEPTQPLAHTARRPLGSRILLAALLALVATGAGAALAFTRASGAGDGGAVPPPRATPTPAAIAAASAPRPVKRRHVARTARSGAPSGSTTCGDGVAVNSVTSCPFARNVRAAFETSGGARTLRVESPVTGSTYTMSCSPGLPTVCAGGRDARVYIR